MKRITLLFASLLGLFGLTTSSAQSNYDVQPDYDNPLIEEVWQFSSPYSDEGEGNFYSLIERLDECPEDQHPGNDFWHSDWHHGDQTPGTHYFQVEMLDPESLPDQIVFVFTRRNADNDHTTEWSVRGTNNPDASKDECEELAYILTPFSSNTETIISTPFNPDGYQYLRFYSEQQTGSSYGSRGYFHLSRFQLYPVKAITDSEAAIMMLQDAFEKYYAMFDSFPAGVEPGQYGEEEVLAFQDLVLTLDIDYMTDEELAALTKEKAQEMIDAVEAAYQAVLASKITFGLVSGYYRIHAGMEYVNDVVIGQDEEGNDITDSQIREKYMMGHKQDGKYWGIWGTPEDFKEETREIRPLFKVTNMGDGIYDIVSMMYNTRFTDVARSTNVEMTKESENLMAIDAVATMNDISYVNIRVSTQNANDYLYLHQNNHSNGTGKNGFLVGWSKTWDEFEGPKASEWYFEKVDDAEAESIIAAWQPNLDREQWVEDYRNLYDEAKQAIDAAKDVAHIPLITSVEQLTSPYSDSDEGVGAHDLKVLIDGVLGKTDNNNFWHSDWHGAEHAEPKHYLQVELMETMTEPIMMTFSRRHGQTNNQITKWSVYGANEDNIQLFQENLEQLATFDTPFGDSDETITTDLFDTKGYKYLRFYCEDNTSGSAFFFASEFNLYVDRENPNSQYTMMGQVAVDLDNVLIEQADITDEDLTQADVDKLAAAYEAFKSEFVDPAELREVIASVSGKTAIVAVGTNPGFWPDKSTADALDATIAAAKVYDEAGHYTKTQSSKFIEDLKAQAEAFDAAVIRVQPGKWYRFRYGTEEEYIEHDWPMTGNDANIDDEGVVHDEALYGKYVVVADFSEENDVRTVSPAYADEIAMDNYIFLDENDDINEKDLSLFRFISVGDSAYIIQNKATGLFLLRPDNSSFIRLSPSPSLFTQGIAGWGQNYFPIKNLEGKGLDALHAAQRYNILQTWSGWGNTDGRRGCFFVEEAENVEADYDGTEFQISAKPGTIASYCFPVSLKGEDGMYGVNAAEQTEDGIKLTLVPLTEVAAGRPFLFITDGEYDPEAEEDAEMMPFTHGYDIVAQPADGSIVRGAFYPKTVGQGVITIANNKFTVTKSPNAQTSELSAYIVNGTEGFNDKLTVSFTIDAEGEDGIQETLQKVARTGDIYSLDGRYVGRGNLNSLRTKGVYIVNGVKVVVK